MTDVRRLPLVLLNMPIANCMVSGMAETDKIAKTE